MCFSHRALKHKRFEHINASYAMTARSHIVREEHSRSGTRIKEPGGVELECKT